MIVNGQSIGTPYKLAGRLAYPEEPVRAEVLELPFETPLEDLFVDWQTHAAATQQGKHGLYHATLYPAPAFPMTRAQYIRGADILSEELGLLDPHQRALILHHNEDRSYLHVVWQRTNIDTWKLRNDGSNYSKHERASRRMEREFGHPTVTGKGEKSAAVYDPQPVFNRDEGQQAIRTTGRSIARMKTEIAALYAQARDALAFKQALEGEGYILATGDSGYVVVDGHGGVYSLAGQLKMRTWKLDDFMAPIGLESLPSVGAAKDRQQEINTSKIRKGAP